MNDAAGKLLREEFDRIHAQVMAADKALERHYMPLAKECLEKDDVAGARIIAHKCGDSLACIYILDAIRQNEIARGRLKNETHTAILSAPEPSGTVGSGNSD